MQAGGVRVGLSRRARAGPRFRTWMKDGSFQVLRRPSSGGPRGGGRRWSKRGRSASKAKTIADGRFRKLLLWLDLAPFVSRLVGGAGYHFQVSPTEVSPDQAGPVPSQPLEKFCPSLTVPPSPEYPLALLLGLPPHALWHRGRKTCPAPPGGFRRGSLLPGLQELLYILGVLRYVHLSSPSVAPSTTNGEPATTRKPQASLAVAGCTTGSPRPIGAHTGGTEFLAPTLRVALFFCSGSLAGSPRSAYPQNCTSLSLHECC